jgi:hypothetical protein
MDFIGFTWTKGTRLSSEIQAGGADGEAAEFSMRHDYPMLDEVPG